MIILFLDRNALYSFGFAFLQVTVVVVFLVCHCVKLFINGYEVYELVKSNVDQSNDQAEENFNEGFNEANENEAFGSGQLPIRLTANENSTTGLKEGQGEKQEEKR